MSIISPRISRVSARWPVAAAVAGMATLAVAVAPVMPAPDAAAATRPATAVSQAPPLTSLPLNTANWSGNAGFGSRRPAWYIDNSGTVHLQGAVKMTSTAGSLPNLIGTLQPAARPAQTQFLIVHTFLGTYADLAIDPDGRIFTLAPAAPAVLDLSFVSLEGISYRPSGNGHPIPLNTQNWAGNVPSQGNPAWFTDSSGVVHLQGAVTQVNNTGPGANLVGTLPPAARPAATVYTILATVSGGYADVAILSNGNIELIDPRPPGFADYSLVSLASVTYRRSGQVRTIGLNFLNWSGSAGANSRRPRWYVDGSGLVHLQGAVTQIDDTGPGAKLIALLPNAARPSRTVYTIVHTFLGTYADLAILPNGRIELIDPRPPAVKDYTFVSLESIIYRR